MDKSFSAKVFRVFSGVSKNNLELMKDPMKLLRYSIFFCKIHESFEAFKKLESIIILKKVIFSSN